MPPRCVVVVLALGALAVVAPACGDDGGSPTTATVQPVVAPPAALDATDFRALGPYDVNAATVSGVRRPVAVAAPEGTGPFPVVVDLPLAGDDVAAVDARLAHLASWGFVAAAPGRIDDGRQAVDLFSAVTFQRGSRFEGIADPERLGVIGPPGAVGPLADDPEIDVVVRRRGDGLLGPDWRALVEADAPAGGVTTLTDHLSVAQFRVSLVPGAADAAERGLRPAFVVSAFRGTVAAYQRR